MKLLPNKMYTVAKRIVVRGEPFTEAIVLQKGLFVKETKASFVFLGFTVRKACVVAIKQENEDGGYYEWLTSILFSAS